MPKASTSDFCGKIYCVLTTNAPANTNQPWFSPWSCNASVSPSVHNLNRLLHRLAEADLDFVIVGGFAAMLHGSSLVTRDLDICMVLDAPNVERLRQILADLYPVHRFTVARLPFGTVPAPGTSLQNLYLETTWGALDVLTVMKGVGDFARIKQTAQEIDLLGTKCRLISLDDLITVKESVARPKDLLAASELRTIRDLGPPPS